MNGPAEPPAHFRCGYVTIVGEPNVGKSTLLNCLLRQKVSIVTHKPQTTRHKILGILSTDSYQAIFLDTPGLITPKYMLQQVMMQSADSAMADADILLFMIDAADADPAADSTAARVFGAARGASVPVYLIINKIDLLPRTALLPLIDSWSKRHPFKEIFPVSALNGEGTDALRETIARQLPEHPPFYPTDIVSEKDERFFVSEIIRESIFLECHEEVPYSTTVEIVEFKEREEGKWFISGDIFVERESQKGILIGKGGAMLKNIGRRARGEIEKFLQHPVFLELHVKVGGRWREDEQSLRRFGYSS